MDSSATRRSSMLVAVVSSSLGMSALCGEDALSIVMPWIKWDSPSTGARDHVLVSVQVQQQKVVIASVELALSRRPRCRR